MLFILQLAQLALPESGHRKRKRRKRCRKWRKGQKKNKKKKKKAYLQALPAGNSWVRCPRTPKYNVVFSIKKIGCVPRIQSHGLEVFVLVKNRARPFPDTPKFALARKLVSASGHGHRMPMLKTNVGLVKVNEEVALAALLTKLRFGCCWRSFPDAVIHKVTA